MHHAPAENAAAVVLVRHGETEWSASGRHTSVTDLALTPAGEDAARRLAPALRRWDFSAVFASPRLRARRTAELAGFPHPTIDPNLAEWSYGDYEGRTGADIRAERPDWQLWRHGAPGGESPEQVRHRAESVVSRVLEVTDEGGDVLLVAHGHMLRAVVAAWVGMPADGGCHFKLDTATLSVLGFDHGNRAIRSWNAPLPT